MGKANGKKTGTTKRLKARQKHYDRQNGKCYWCGVQMLEPGTVSPKSRVKPPLNMCTLEHINHKFDRGPGIVGSYVAACLACNQDRGRDRVRQEPIERLWKESGRKPSHLR